MDFGKNVSDINKVIDELSRIDKAAEGYATSLEDQKAKMLSDYQHKRTALETEFQNRRQEKIQKYREQLEKENAEQIAKLRKESEEYLAALDKAFEANHSQWAEEIMKTIIAEQ